MDYKSGVDTVGVRRLPVKYKDNVGILEREVGKQIERDGEYNNGVYGPNKCSIFCHSLEGEPKNRHTNRLDSTATIFHSLPIFVLWHHNYHYFLGNSIKVLLSHAIQLTLDTHSEVCDTNV